MALEKSDQPRMHTDTHGLSKECIVRLAVGVSWYQKEGMEYPALFEPATEGGFVVTFPDFAWGSTQGDTEEEAREMATDAIRTMIREHIRNGEELPRPGKARARKYRMIRLGALDAMKASLYLA